MVGQLARTAARRAVTRACADTVLACLNQNTGAPSSFHGLSATVVRHAGELLLGRAITDEEIEANPDLDVLKLGREAMLPTEVQNQFKKAVDAHLGALATEDLGGIAELLSGHEPTEGEEGRMVFMHNPERRGTGRVYTPFDVTLHMCTQTIPKLVDACKTYTEFLDLRILDPAVGSGAFLAQAMRTLATLAEEKWPAEAKSVRSDLGMHVLFGVDLDPFASDLCRFVLWLEAGGPSESIAHNIRTFDSLSGGPNPGASWGGKEARDFPKSFDLCIGNPPYVRIRSGEFSDFSLADARNLFALFCELGLNLTRASGLFSMIIPQSVMGSKDADILRAFLLEENGAVKFQVFDSVPDFLFDQGKIDNNTNTNINQRTVIVSVDRSAERRVTTSPLLRWRRREERDVLFSHLTCHDLQAPYLVNNRLPMLRSEHEHRVLRRMLSSNGTIADTLSSEGAPLHLSKAVRYFITATPTDLGRKNSIHLSVQRAHFPLVHVLLNSNAFYWWWRVMGNGFQVELRDVHEFPLLSLKTSFFESMSQSLLDAESGCRVVKRNAGKDIPNINFNFRQDLLAYIDSEIMDCLDLHDAPFFSSKSNSLFGKTDQLVGYGGAV